jgi:hypothetical protein
LVWASNVNRGTPSKIELMRRGRTLAWTAASDGCGPFAPGNLENSASCYPDRRPQWSAHEPAAQVQRAWRFSELLRDREAVTDESIARERRA